MRKLGSFLVLALLVAAPAAAQDTPQGEVFLGYSYIRSDSANLNGWNAAVQGNVNSWFSVVGDFSGHYFPPANLNIHTFTFGPRFTYRGHERVQPFVHALFGGARASVLGVSDTAFAANVGGGVDIKAADWLAIRAIQADALITRFGGTTTADPRLSFGVVFRFGKK
jgi:hypothetical protein